MKWAKTDVDTFLLTPHYNIWIVPVLHSISDRFSAETHAADGGDITQTRVPRHVHWCMNILRAAFNAFRHTAPVIYLAQVEEQAYLQKLLNKKYEFDIQRTVHRDIVLQWKPTRCTISQIYLINYSTCFGHVHCPSSGVSQHCIHAISICHASYVGVC
jgi:hypothetical protein